ncbi:hypothetical protein J6590_024649 [Homalodisca vitripennis]|nr:hypothetical protein J6590_024649 [Homalodisca vitripennis]
MWPWQSVIRIKSIDHLVTNILSRSSIAIAMNRRPGDNVLASSRQTYSGGTHTKFCFDDQNSTTTSPSHFSLIFTTTTYVTHKELHSYSCWFYNSHYMIKHLLLRYEYSYS